MPGSDGKEKRKYPRFSTKITMVHSSSPENKSRQDKTQNISAIGIGFLTTEELRPGTHLEISLIMPDNGEEIRVKGDVAWSVKVANDSYMVGVNLKDPSLKPIPIVLRAIQARL